MWWKNLVGPQNFMEKYWTSANIFLTVSKLSSRPGWEYEHLIWAVNINKKIAYPLSGYQIRMMWFWFSCLCVIYWYQFYGNKTFWIFSFRDQYRNAPFTTFYVTVGNMIKEIHRCLLLLLGSEPSAIVITQVIKVIFANSHKLEIRWRSYWHG